MNNNYFLTHVFMVPCKVWDSVVKKQLSIIKDNLSLN